MKEVEQLQNIQAKIELVTHRIGAVKFANPITLKPLLRELAQHQIEFNKVAINAIFHAYYGGVH